MTSRTLLFITGSPFLPTSLEKATFLQSLKNKMRYKPPEVWDGGGAMEGREELPPVAAAGTEAGLSLFFSDELNLEGEKKICP